jgi:hypothetical protein
MDNGTTNTSNGSNGLAPLTLPTGDELAGRLVDLAHDAWALRGRVVDVRDIRAGFNIDPVAYDSILSLDAEQRRAVVDFVTFTTTDEPLLCGLRVHRDPGLFMPARDAGRWAVVLIMAPGDPE